MRLEVFFNKEKGTHLKCKKKTGSNIAAHAWRNNLSSDFNNARVTNKESSELEKPWNLGTLLTLIGSRQNNTLVF